MAEQTWNAIGWLSVEQFLFRINEVISKKWLYLRANIQLWQCTVGISVFYIALLKTQTFNHNILFQKIYMG